MKFGYWNGYAAGFEVATVESRQEFERTLAVIREELADARRDRDTQMTRADFAADLLLQHLGARAISLAGKQEETARTERTVKNVGALTAAPDPFDLPLGHPSGRYRTAAEAALGGSDEDLPPQERAH